MRPRKVAEPEPVSPARMRVALKLAALPALPPAFLEREARAVGVTPVELVLLARRGALPR